MVESTRPNTLLVGPSNSGKRALASRIVTEEVHSVVNCCCWLIDTDYYTAETEIHIKRLEDASTEAATEAVVLVFDCSDEESWNKTRQWAEDANVEHAEITLCVANKWDAKKTEGEWLAAVEHWCLTHHFEFIRSSAANIEFDQSLVEDDTPQGVRRVIAALKAHMWPGLTLKDRNKPSTAQQLNRGSLESQEAPTTDSHQLDESFEFDADDDEDEKEIQDVEKLFLEVVTMRDRLQTLSDAGRRDAAARMALKLADMLGLDDEDDSEDEGVDVS